MVITERALDKLSKDNKFVQIGKAMAEKSTKTL